jgi:hypothetical protein
MAQFEARRDAVGNVELFSVDHFDLRVTNERCGLAHELLEGMPHSLLCASSQGELSVLLPNVLPCRPTIKASPFSTALVLDRTNSAWNEARSLAYHLMPIHLSQTLYNRPPGPMEPLLLP